MYKHAGFVIAVSFATSSQGFELIHEDDFETLSCTADRDGDRLGDCVETNSGVFVSTQNTGTYRRYPDSDLDGIRDGDEVLGTAAGLDLPSLGVNPLRRDVLIEYDWLADNYADACDMGEHRPSAASIAQVASVFAVSPIRNPDGSTGVHVIQDFGHGGLFSGGNLVADTDGVVQGRTDEPDFQSIRQANFAANRRGYFHYGLMAHRFDFRGITQYTGQGEIFGDEFMVALYCLRNDYNQATAIAHELGHNLGLRHGGDTDCGFKPNYNSVMNYRYQFYGLDAQCTGVRGALGSGAIGFSRGVRLALNESSLAEPPGMCGVPIDWNFSGAATDVGVVRDLNSQDSDQVERCGGTHTTLTDHDDWFGMTFNAVSPIDAGAIIGAGDVEVCESAPQ